MASSNSNLVIRELETDAAGVLHVKGIDVTGDTRFIFRTQGEEQTERLVKLLPIEEPSKPSRDVTKQAKEVEEESEGVKEVVESKIYRKTQRKKEFVESTVPIPFDTTGMIQLNEVMVMIFARMNKKCPQSVRD